MQILGQTAPAMPQDIVYQGFHAPNNIFPMNILAQGRPYTFAGPALKSYGNEKKKSEAGFLQLFSFIPVSFIYSFLQAQA